MRIAIVGATGNAGTALLRSLVAEPQVTSVLGLARRLPDRSAEPYRHAERTALDIAADDADDAVVARLAEAFQGADAVVHLAWLIQPNRDRDLLRRTNVEGTRRVALAAARAGVPHLVVASSVGAYSPVDDDAPRREDWPTGGIPTSHYSVDKAAQERVLDAVERDHPGLTVARMRTALVFQADAAHEIVRYFLGPLVPVQLLRHGRPPLVPLPAGLRLQAVHAADAADAYRRVILDRAGGGFNVAADDLLRGPDLARIVDHGRLVEVPRALTRAVVVLAYRSRAIPSDPGMLDMAMGMPVLDTTRARSELGWQPRHTAAEAVSELLEGMSVGQGVRSAPMRPAMPRPATTSVIPLHGGAAARIPDHLDGDLLGLYLSDHFTGATAGLQRMERIASAYRDTPLHPELAEVAVQIRGERELYRMLLDRLDVRRRRPRQVAAWAVERVARLQLNGRVAERSPMSAVLEAELMRSAVLGKIGGWQTLREHAEELGLDPAQFDELIALAQGQIDVLDRFHAHARARAFRRDRNLADGAPQAEGRPGLAARPD